MFKIFGYEFTVKKVKERKKAKGFSSKSWNKSEKDHLLRRHGEKIPMSTIAKELNRTIPSVHSMMYKLHRKKK